MAQNVTQRPEPAQHKGSQRRRYHQRQILNPELIRLIPINAYEHLFHELIVLRTVLRGQ